MKNRTLCTLFSMFIPLAGSLCDNNNCYLVVFCSLCYTHEGVNPFKKLEGKETHPLVHLTHQ